MSRDLILVLSLKPKPEANSMVALWKNRYDVITLPSVLPFGCNLVSIWHAKSDRKTANIIVKKT